MAVALQYTSELGLKTELVRYVKLRTVDVVAAVDETPVVGGATQLAGDDLGAVFGVYHDGTAGVITITVQQSSDNGSSDVYASVASGLIDRDGAIATAVDYDVLIDGPFLLLGLNPAKVREKWVRLSLTPDTDYDGTAITIVCLSGQLRSAK